MLKFPLWAAEMAVEAFKNKEENCWCWYLENDKAVFGRLDKVKTNKIVVLFSDFS